MQGRFWLNTLLAALVGFVFSLSIASVFPPVYFVGLVAGGFVGGLFHGRGTARGALVGAASGVVATVPFVGPLLVFLLVGFGGLAAVEPTVLSVLLDDALRPIAGYVGLLLVGGLFLGNAISGLVGGLIGGAMSPRAQEYL